MVGSSFYVILSGNASVYIDPRMTGEDDGAVREKTPPPKVANQTKSENGEEGEENNEEEEGEDGEEKGEEGDEEERKRQLERELAEKKIMPLDRNKFGKFIMTYGKLVSSFQSHI